MRKSPILYELYITAKSSTCYYEFPSYYWKASILLQITRKINRNFPLLGENRSSIGCRTLIQRNFSKILPALLGDLTDWVINTRIKVISNLPTILNMTAIGLSRVILHAMIVHSHCDILTLLLSGRVFLYLYSHLFSETHQNFSLWNNSSLYFYWG